MGEQSNTWPILLGNDRKSRHRRIKKRRRYELLAATSQFLSTILPPLGLPLKGSSAYKNLLRFAERGSLFPNFGEDQENKATFR